MRAATDMTVLIPVYAGDAPGPFAEALESVFQGADHLTEIIICEDGPLTEPLDALAEQARLRGARRITNAGPRGLHHNLNHAAQAVNTTWIARADADDINRSDRFARQAAFIAAHPEVDLFSSALEEMAPDGTCRIKTLPIDHADLARWARWRSPINHNACVFRRSLFEACGGYPDIRFKEDYALWLTMLGAGARLANDSEPLVQARLGAGFHRRRAGLGNIGSEWRLAQLRRTFPSLRSGARRAFAVRAAALTFTPATRWIYEGVLRR